MLNLQPNCSETVYRIKKSELNKLSDKEKEELEAITKDMKKPIDELVKEVKFGEYSNVRPRNNSEICFYAYQYSGMELWNFLKSKKMKFEGEFPFVYPEIENFPDCKEVEK